MSNLPKTIFRSTPEMKQWLMERAERNGRTMNSELIQILKAAQHSETTHTAN